MEKKFNAFPLILQSRRMRLEYAVAEQGLKGSSGLLVGLSERLVGGLPGCYDYDPLSVVSLPSRFHQKI